MLLEDHIHGVEEAFLILRAFDEHMIARLQSGRLHVIAIFDELCFFRALEIDDACILGLDDDLLILQGAQHSGDTLQILVILFLFRSLLILAARHGNARTARIVAPGVTAAGISARRIAAAWVLAAGIRSDLRQRVRRE